MAERSKPGLTLLGQRNRLEGYWDALADMHAAYRQAQQELETTIGRPICVAKCGMCCQHASPLAYGFEAEYAVTVLMGQPQTLAVVLPRIRDWLTAKKPTDGRWTMTSAMKDTKVIELQPELAVAVNERCAFLADDMTCMVHMGRPLVCRSYGVTHMPNNWCPRGVGLGEDADSRAFVDPDAPERPLRPMWNALKRSVTERRFARWGFFATFIYERFRAKDLAGLVDDNKVPLVKLYQNWGKSPMMLWQEDVDEAWRAEGADLSIAETPPMKDNGHGGLRLFYDFRKKRYD